MKHWSALYTKPRKEFQVEAWLKQQGIEAYLPTVQRRVRRRDRPDRVAFFPCYLFAHVDWMVIPPSSISWMPGVRRIVCAGDRPTVVADELVDLVRRRLEGKEECEFGGLNSGDRVRIVSGPLKDLQAVFDRPSSATERVRVLLSVMGRMVTVELDARDVVRA